MKLHAESPCILHAKEFLLYFTWPLIVTLLRVYTKSQSREDMVIYAQTSILKTIKLLQVSRCPPCSICRWVDGRTDATIRITSLLSSQ